MKPRSLVALGVVLVSFTAAGCSTDDPVPPRIEASVSYRGAAVGTLVVAAFPDMPPRGAPAAFAQKSAAEFPAVVVLEAVEPDAMLYVLAMLDVTPASPQQPGPEDRTVWSTAVTVAHEGATTVSLSLTDP
jgi:hypothetical protein